jgi:hypothetical protein
VVESMESEWASGGEAGSESAEKVSGVDQVTET